MMPEPPSSLGCVGWALQCLGVHGLGRLDAVSPQRWGWLGAPMVGTEMPPAPGAGGAWGGHPDSQCPGELCQAVGGDMGWVTHCPEPQGAVPGWEGCKGWGPRSPVPRGMGWAPRSPLLQPGGARGGYPNSSAPEMWGGHPEPQCPRNWWTPQSPVLQPGGARGGHPNSSAPGAWGGQPGPQCLKSVRWAPQSSVPQPWGCEGWAPQFPVPQECGTGTPIPSTPGTGGHPNPQCHSLGV